MRAPVIEGDAVFQADELWKGTLVLMDKRGWYERFRQLEVRNLVTTFLTFLFVFLPLGIIIGMWFDIQGLIICSAWGLVLPLGITLLYYIEMRRTLKAVRKRYEEGRELPGLYENGIIFPDTFLHEPKFIPYHKITALSSHRSLSGESVRILYGSAELGHRVPLVFLGDDGLAYLRSSIGKGPPSRKPPQLILYPKPDMASQGPSESEDLD